MNLAEDISGPSSLLTSEGSSLPGIPFDFTRTAEEAIDTGEDLTAFAENFPEEFMDFLFQKYSEKMRRIIRRILPEFMVSDVIQEVMIKVREKLSEFRRERASFGTWIVLITRSKAIDIFRTYKKIEGAEKVVRDEHAASPQSEEPLVLENLLRSELGEKVSAKIQQALARLPLEQRVVIELAYWEGLTQTEVAAKLDLPLGTVKTRTLLGLKRLRSILQDRSLLKAFE